MTTRLSRYLQQATQWSGRLLLWTPIAMVAVQFSLVISYSFFGVGAIAAQESLQYINALMFLGGAGYTALAGEHVRVDIFYGRFDARRKAWVNLAGTFLMLFPFLGFFTWISLPYVLDSWQIHESSVEASGLPFVYLLKSCLLLFPFTLLLAGLCDILKQIDIIRRGGTP